MESLHANHSRIKILVRLQKFPQRLRRDIAAARNRDMRMPGTKLRLQPSRERGFIHALVDLEQMWVRLANADPNNFRSAFCREHSDADDGQKECAELDRAEFFAQRKLDVVCNIAEESERQMHLRRVNPAHAANVRIKVCEELARCLRKVDRDEKALGHLEANFQLSIRLRKLRRDRHPTSNAKLNPVAISDRDYNDLPFVSLLRALALSAARVSQAGIKRHTSEPVRDWFPSAPDDFGKNRFTSCMA